MQRQGDILYIYAFTYELLNIGLKSRLHHSIYIFTLFIISVLALGHYLCEKYYLNMVFGYVWEANAVGIPHPVFIKQYE